MQEQTQVASMDLDTAIDHAHERYVSERPVSRALAAEATTVLPGGNTRSVLDFSPFPFRVDHTEGPMLVDVDGHRYLDLLGNYTAGLLGHTPGPVRDAIIDALDRGWSTGAMRSGEIELARLISDRFPSIDMVRFTNSGTEANLMAIAASLNVTGRRRVAVARGGYHGGVLYFGPTGRPLNVPHDWVFFDYNDTASVEALFAEHGATIGCVLIEPMMGASGCIPADREFLATIRAETKSYGSVLVFDEVMTSRLSPAGAQGLLGITPDMTTLGKYLGGGMTFGAFGGRRGIMSVFDPASGGGLTHGGTFNNNTVTMAAGVAALTAVLTDDALAAVNRRGDDLRERLNVCFAAGAHPMSVTGWGSIMNIHATRGPVRSPDDLTHADDRWKELFFHAMLDSGFYMARRGLMALTLEITDADLDRFVAAVAAWTADPTGFLDG